MGIIYEPAGKAKEYAPWAANLYRGCAHGCAYCYAPNALFTDREEFHAKPKARKDILAAFEKDCRKLSGRINNILLSFSTDPYQPIESELGLTRQAIEIAHRHGIGVQILTKGGLRAVRDFDLLGDADAFACTLTFLNDAPSLEWEPQAARPEERIASLKQAHEKGIFTWVSLEPVIEPETTLEIIRQTAGFVDQYKVGMLNYHPLTKEIDWLGFGKQAMELLRSLEKAFYIKEDLRKHAGLTEYEYWPETTRRYPSQAALTKGALC